MLPFSGSPFLGLLVVWSSSVRRWPDTRLMERMRQNKVEDNIMIFEANNLHRQDSNVVINDGKEGFGPAYYTNLYHQRIIFAPGNISLKSDLNLDNI